MFNLVISYHYLKGKLKKYCIDVLLSLNSQHRNAYPERHRLGGRCLSSFCLANSRMPTNEKNYF